MIRYTAGRDRDTEYLIGELFSRLTANAPYVCII